MNSLWLYSPFPNCGLLLTHMKQTNFEASAADDNWKHCDKRRNCSLWAISLFGTIFSILFHDSTYIFRDFSIVLHRCFLISLHICCVWKMVKVCDPLMFNEVWFCIVPSVKGVLVQTLSTSHTNRHSEVLKLII